MSYQVNRYAGPCAVCGARVAAKAGWLTKRDGVFAPLHLACAKGSAAVDTYIVGSAFAVDEYTRNARGRCEDAPCCGCCTI